MKVAQIASDSRGVPAVEKCTAAAGWNLSFLYKALIVERAKVANRSPQVDNSVDMTFPKILAALLIIGCIVLVVWVGYFFFDEGINPVVGAIAAVGGIWILFWCYSAMRRSSVGLASVMMPIIAFTLLAGTVGAFTGVQPLSTYKENIFGVVDELSTGIKGVGSPGISEMAAASNIAVTNQSPRYLYALTVNIRPWSSAVADKGYLVNLYEKGKLRDTSIVSWNQQQLDISEAAVLEFPITSAEYEAYLTQDLSQIFTVRLL